MIHIFNTYGILLVDLPIHSAGVTYLVNGKAVDLVGHLHTYERLKRRVIYVVAYGQTRAEHLRRLVLSDIILCIVECPVAHEIVSRCSVFPTVCQLVALAQGNIETSKINITRDRDITAIAWLPI